MSGNRTDGFVSDEIYMEIQRFLNRETVLLDRREFQQWFALMTDDIRYRVMAHVNRDAQSARLDYAFIDEDPVSLQARVTQVSNPKLTHAENPPSLTRRFISSVEARAGETADEFLVTSSILVYRNRPGREEGFYVGERRDVLRRVDGSLRIARRDVHLDHAVLRGAVSTLF
jgi:3-phenylpropionate/cinnamic acid dioxygenase small subunit